MNLFIYFERERERKEMRMSGGGAEREREREGGRERIPSKLHAVITEPDSGLDLTNHEIMT